MVKPNYAYEKRQKELAKKKKKADKRLQKTVTDADSAPNLPPASNSDDQAQNK